MCYYYFSTQLKDTKMENERCMCGATDCRICGPLQGYALSAEPTERELELALDADLVAEYAE